MNWRIAKGYLLTVPCGLVVIAGIILLVLQWDMKSSFLLYGKHFDQTVNTAALIIVSMLTGVLLPYLLKGLLRGVLLINAERSKKTKIKIKKTAQAASTTPANKPDENITQDSTKPDGDKL